ncbi:MAG: choice-of-anchor D domain-containing protein [Myxococcota bacterium]
MVRHLNITVLAALALLGGCRGEKLVEAACREDVDCDSGLLCEDFRCIPAETKSCEVVVDGNPILQPAPHAASFGDIDAAEVSMTIELHNLGNCTLTVFEASLAKAGATPFSCDVCDPANFPLEIFPGRKKDVQLTFKSTQVGRYADDLVILSDDREFGELRVPLHANFLGVPELRVAPNPVDFGYVAQGRSASKTIQITNQGTGVASLVVQSVVISPPDTDDFELVNPPTEATTLAPVSTDPRAVLSFEIQYHPRSTTQHEVLLLLETSKGPVQVPVRGNAATPPKLNVTPLTIDLGQVPLGATVTRPLTIDNQGGAPLIVDYKWGGANPNTDLFAVPTLVPPIAPGAYTELQVAVTATTTGPINGLLLLGSNDPARPSVTIAVSATGVPGPGPQVVKVEMTYENGSDGAFDSDIRNVDMTLEHPFGYVCNKQNPNPTNWGNYGNPSWISFGPKEEPERIVLADAQVDGTYRVMLQYMEDCSSLPTALLAGILGISVDVLIAYLTGGVGGPINGQDVGKLIQNVCLDHSSTAATVRVYVNGTIVHEKTVSLGSKGTTVYAADLVRANGAFTAQ